MSDEELIYLIREKNEDAEQLFIQKYEKVIQRTSFASVGYFAQDNEVKSMAYMVLMQCVQSYDGMLNSLFGTYYNTCLRNRLKSLLRQYRYGVKRQWMYNYQDITEIEVSDCTLHDPVQQYIAEEVWNDVSDNLSPLEQTIFQQSLDGYNSAEIAQSAAISIKKVYNTMHKVKKMLKQ